jgi:hypothetical protein
VTTIYGWDMSHYDDVKSDTAEKVIAEGFSFVTHKAGGDGNDAELDAWWNEFKGHRDKLLLGAYWVLYPGNPVARANAFCDRLDAICKGWGDTPFILQVDCEKWNNNSATVPGKADIKAFCDQLRKRAPKLRPIVYAPRWVYQNSLSGLGYPLWASAYVSGDGAASKLYPGDSSSKWDAYSGQTPAILQFTSSSKIAGQTTSDANAFKGTLAQLTALVAPGWSSSAAPDTEEDMDLTAANLRDIAKANWNTDGIIEAPAGSKNADGSPNAYLAPKTFIKNMNNSLTALQSAVAAQSKTIAALASKGDVDPKEIVDGILAGLTTDVLGQAIVAAGLTPAAIASAIPADLAEGVVDALGGRLDRTQTPAAPTA